MESLNTHEEQYVTDNDQKAEWALEKLREIDADEAKWIEHYEAQKQKMREDSARRREYFMMQLEDYFDTVPHKETKTQESYSLPSGKLVLKKPRIEYKRDNNVLVNYLEQNGLTDYINVAKTPAWAEYKEKITVMNGFVIDKETGEIVDGVTAEEGPEVFKVEV